MKEYKNYLCGDYLTEADCKRLLAIHEMNDNYDKTKKHFDDLEHIIRDLPPEEVAKIKKDPGYKPEKDYEGTLTDLQTIGVGYMYYAGRVLLGDSVGFGKTPQCAGLANLLTKKYPKTRFIYFTKKTLAEKDQNELIRFTGSYVGMLKGETASLKKELAKITEEDLPYSFVAVHSVIKNPVFQDWYKLYEEKYGHFPFDIVFIDEASSVATAKKSDFTKPAQVLCKSCDRVILMNATPFESRLESFRVQMNLVDDTLLPNKTVFQRTFQKMRNNGQYLEYIEEYKNEEAFKDAIKLRFLARRRKENGGKMENCHAKLIIVPKSKDQIRLEKLTSIPQMVYDCPSAIDKGLKMTPETCPKLQTVLDLVNNEGKDEPNIMIYCQYKESQDGIMEVLQQQGYACEKMNGDTKTADRLRITKDFQDGKFKVLVTNVQEGLNFGNCNMTIFYSALPNPNRMVQVEGRMLRSFDIKDKHIYLLATKGRELRNIKDIISNRAKFSEKFAGSDYSLVLDLLREQGN